MEAVHLTPAGLLATPEGAAVLDPLPALHSRLHLDVGCSLRSFFAMLGRYPLLQSLSAFLPAACAEAAACPATGCKDDEIYTLVIGKTMELIGFPGEPRAEIYLWLRGLTATSSSLEATSDTPAEEDHLPAHARADKEIRFISLQSLLDLPLVLGGLKHTVLGGTRRELFCTTTFTLFETIDGLAWEFGFQGGAQQCSIER